MRFNSTMMKSTALLLILALPMTGCATVPISSCPPLSQPPVAAVDALQAAGNSAVDAWVVDLDRHYQKLEICRKLR